MGHRNRTHAPGLTMELAQMVAAVRYSEVPKASVMVARHSILDCLGVAIAGASEPLSDIVCRTFANGGSASIFGRSGSASPHDAALINGTLSHALDYDDAVQWGHPTPPILPAVLAVAEANGKSCKEALLAYIVGFEAASVIGRQAMATHYAKGFHSTGTIGTFGAAAAVAKLLELDVGATAHAFGLAATQAAGLKCMNGTMAKAFHAGKAASNGVVAGMLASQGFVARSDVLEAEQGFFFCQTDVSPTGVADYKFGQFLPTNRFKFHAACYMTHSAIVAIGNLRQAHGLSADDVDAIGVELSDIALGICNIQDPQNGLECKFSLRQCAAFAVAGLDTSDTKTYSDANANNPVLVALRSRVSVHGRKKPGTDATVTITLKNGTCLHQHYDIDGTTPNPALQEKALLEKFLRLTEPVLGNRAQALADAILDFETLGTVNRFMAWTRPSHI